MNSDITKLMSDKIDENDSSRAPINLNISNMIPINLKLLMWYNYEIPPNKLKMTNTGRTVIINGEWNMERPYLTSGPLLNDYSFSQIHFHWGPNDMIGSEHFLDGGSQPMELHAVHYKTEYLNQESAMTQIDGIIILVYLFKLQTSVNPAFNSIITSLPLIHQPCSTVHIVNEPLIKILRPFIQDYFLYRGAITKGDFSHWIKWLISREPIGISLEQTAEFRKLNNKKYKPNLNNCKQLRDEKNTCVFHINPSGSCYASLLPIPRDSPPLTASQRAFTMEN
ncbi:hypothetical protein PV327_001772 [Microctonus hyperodae]|uniref:Alpha-carbonic anhydrase domain-containing protein n=1 Tax=Microctonus hyperodae TaxID=165561 RepID=A0AA39KNG8_MICHY|nr:hypothetical protein PV327_001772 [Microctonus hyperodae]